MDMTAKTENEILCVAFFGEIDHYEAGKVRSTLDEIIFDERPKELIFDFSGVRSMDSSGIGLVLGRHRIIKEMGGTTSVVGASRAIETIFKMSGVNKIIKVN